VKLTFFGVRGSCPCSSEQQRRYGGNTSCVLVEVDGEPPLLLDLGTGLREVGCHLRERQATGDGPFRATALLTHLHYDHVLGLPFFSPLRDPGARLDIHGPSQPDGDLGEVLSGMVRPPFFPISMDEFKGEMRGHAIDGSAELTVGGIEITARPVPHVGPTLGFRIEAEGRSVAYVSDHQAPVDRRQVDKQVLELCDRADLVVHDAQYTDDEFEALAGWGHSTADYAVRVAGESGARRLMMFHHDPAHSDGQIDRMLDGARQAAERYRCDVAAASEGATLDLGAA
jgi:ribonuclease BN (tRNA processing enzyme)